MIRIIKVVTLSDKVNLTLLDQYKVVLTLESEDKIPKLEHLDKGYYRAALTRWKVRFSTFQE